MCSLIMIKFYLKLLLCGVSIFLMTLMYLNDNFCDNQEKILWEWYKTKFSSLSQSQYENRVRVERVQNSPYTNYFDVTVSPSQGKELKKFVKSNLNQMIKMKSVKVKNNFNFTKPWNMTLEFSEHFSTFHMYDDVIQMTDENQEKLILIYNKFYGKFSMEFCSYSQADSLCHLESCPHKCTFTHNKNYSDKAHVIVFSYWDDTLFPEIPRLPNRNSKDQFWVGYVAESGAYLEHSGLDGPLDSALNWSATFRRDSDIPLIGDNFFEKVNDTARLVNVNTVTKSSLFNDDIKSKKLAVALISNCNTPSGRNWLIRVLQEYLPVDVYGKCGTPCPRNETINCRKYLAQRYKFILAFENSLCQDYVTEKFFLPFTMDIVPVVYGLAHYDGLAPSNSFINIMDFPTAESLAKYLIHLNQNDEEYVKYFEWKNDYAVMMKNTNLFCQICQKLWSPQGNYRKEYFSLFKWWTTKGPPSSNYPFEGIKTTENPIFNLSSKFRPFEKEVRVKSESCIRNPSVWLFKYAQFQNNHNLQKSHKDKWKYRIF